MAHMNQSKKKTLAPGIKDVLKKYGMHGTLSIDSYSTLVLTLTHGMIDFGKDYDRQVNVYWIQSYFEGQAKDFLLEVLQSMMVGNHDKSDISYDYHDVGWYVSINIGSHSRPYFSP